MEIEELKLKFEELISSLDNQRTQETLKESKYDIEELNKTINNYLENIQNIGLNERDILQSKIFEMFKLCKRGLEKYKLDEFITLANFIKNKAPKKIEKIEDKRIEISEEEFTKRFNSWLNLLNSKNEKKSNFILLVDSIEYEFYKTKDNNVLFIKVRKGKELFSPEYINLIELSNIAFKGEKGNTKIAEVIASKIKDKSIFDFFITDDSLELFETMKNRLSKQEDELSSLKDNLKKLQEQNQLFEDTKTKLDEIIDKSKVAQDEYTFAKNAAVDDAKLKKSLKYWEIKQKRHDKKFWIFIGVAIFLIILLIGLLSFGINFYKSENEKSIPPTSVSSNISDKSKDKENNLNNKSEEKEQKNVSNELKVQKEGKDNKSLQIDVNVQIENLTKQYKEESNIESQETSDKKGENSFLKDFENSNLPWYFLIIFASSSAFWIIRITVKIALSNLHLSEDAHERVVMIYTYLSFVQKGQLDDEKEDKKLILSSLFRPSNIGIIQDESSVTVTDIITAFKK